MDPITGYLATLLLSAGAIVCIRGAVTLADERARGTLEPLWMAQIEPTALVQSKLLAILRSVAWILLAIAVLAAFGYPERMKTPGVWGHVIAFAEALAVASAHAFVLASLSLAISAYTSSTRWALVMGIVALISFDVGTLIVSIGLSSFLPSRAFMFVVAANPVFQVSVVSAHITGFSIGVSVPMLFSVVLTEVAIGLSAISLAMRRMERDLPDLKQLKSTKELARSRSV
jgi:hypothetical protein